MSKTAASTASRFACLLGLAAGALSPWAAAQGVPPARSPVGTAPATPTEVSSMERAQRLAANPMRVILEAARIRRKGEGEDGDGAALKRTAPRTPGAGVVARESTAPRSAAATGATGATVMAAAVDNAAPAPAAVAATEGSPVRLGAVPADADRPMTPEDAPLPTVVLRPPSDEASAPAPAADRPVGLPPAVDPAPAAPAAAALPRLVRRVDPDVPMRVLDLLPRGEAFVDLTLRADGSVADVTLVPPAPRALHRHVAEALGQWVFEPLPGPRVHRVQLVFDAAR